MPSSPMVISYRLSATCLSDIVMVPSWLLPVKACLMALVTASFKNFLFEGTVLFFRQQIVLPSFGYCLLQRCLLG